MAWIDSMKVGAVHGMCGTTACRRGGTTRGREDQGPRPSLEGMRDRPTCAHDAGWGDRRFGTALRLFDNRWMHVCRKRRGSLAMAGGRMAVSHEITRLPGGGVIRSPSHCWCLASKSLKPWRNGERARLSLGRVRVRVPSASSGSCSSPVERLVEAQRGAGSIPAGATCCRRGGMHTRDAQNVVGHVPVGVRIPPAVLAGQGSSAAEQRPHKPRDAGPNPAPAMQALVAQTGRAPAS
jgi:hypothetical protein